MNPTRPSADRLYEDLLPEVYRTEDNGDLRKFLDAFGGVLDSIRDVLDQRLADAFPNDPDATLQSQAWILPYLAALLDMRPVSTDPTTSSVEVERAIAWRKRKGSIGGVLEIANALGEFEWPNQKQPYATIVLQEGLARVAVTPRIERLPGAKRATPMGTVDLRRRSRRVVPPPPPGQTAPPPSVQANPYGVPCFPGTSEDVSRRTPDVRAPTAKVGHCHPKRVLLFTAPRPGFFPPEVMPEGPGPDIDVAGGPDVELHDAVFAGTVLVHGGPLIVRRCAIGKLVFAATGTDTEPLLQMEDSLVGSIESLNGGLVQGLVELVGVTVTSRLAARHAWVSDSILPDTVEIAQAGTPPLEGGASGRAPFDCFRYSRIPESLFAEAAARNASSLRIYRCVADAPIFAEKLTKEGKRQRTAFGDLGYGVLAPECPRALREGAEDGGEMGAYHHLRYVLRERAILDKLRDYLPAGQVAVVIPDPKLVCKPPTARQR